jgi:hypothetical protein
MNCFDARRSLLTTPRDRSDEQRAHLARCADCARLAYRLGSLERELEDAALVSVPDALAARVLLVPRGVGSRRYALAALLAGMVAGLGLLTSGVVNAPGVIRAGPVQAVGPTHPAVAAIAEVANEEAPPGGAMSAKEEKADTEQSLKRLGLTLKDGEASVHYLGKCRIEGSSECEHIVLSTADAHANVMLVPDYPLRDRVLVADRHMVALVSPAGRGGYIVVGDSEKTVRRMEKLIVKG